MGSIGPPSVTLSWQKSQYPYNKRLQHFHLTKKELLKTLLHINEHLYHELSPYIELDLKKKTKQDKISQTRLLVLIILILKTPANKQDTSKGTPECHQKQ